MSKTLKDIEIDLDEKENKMFYKTSSDEMTWNEAKEVKVLIQWRQIVV